MGVLSKNFKNVKFWKNMGIISNFWAKTENIFVLFPQSMVFLSNFAKKSIFCPNENVFRLKRHFYYHENSVNLTT